MDELAMLSSLGLTVPTPAYIVGSIVFGIAGYLTYRRGRNTSNFTLIGIGVGLMVYPYLVPQTWMLWVIGAALSAWAYANWD